MNKLACVVSFAIGAAVGSFVTWKIVKTKYEQLAQEEIDSVKEVYSRNKKEDESEETEQLDTDISSDEETDKQRQKDITKDNGYSNGNVMNAYPKPFTITPEEFGETMYKTETLYYYADEILADENDKEIVNVDELVGLDSLSTFGQYDDDAVYVRNEKLKTDFEILLSLKEFNDLDLDLGEDEEPEE